MTPTREIMWNVSSLPNTVAMYAFMAVSLFVAAIGLLRHLELILSGAADSEYRQSFPARIKSLFVKAFLQKKVVQKKSVGAFHTLIYFGFFVLLFTTTMVLIDHDLGIRIYQGDFYLAVTLLSDIFGFGVIIGCGLAAHRRWILKPDYLHSRAADSYLLWMLVLLCVQGFLLEGLRIHATQDPWAHYSPIGNMFAGLFWGLSENATKNLHFFSWWFHALTVFSFIALIPYTKFFHIIASSANLYFQPRSRAKGQIKSPGDIEKLMEESDEFSIGLGSIKDYTWKNLLDLEACTSCGRCQEVCPAYISGKPLSPKWLILDTRNHLLGLGVKGQITDESILPTPLKTFDSSLQRRYLENSSGMVLGDGSDESASIMNPELRGENSLVQKSPKAIAGQADARIAGEVLGEDVFWSCTTCMACVQACPVGINHVDQIVGNRQNMVLMQGEVPTEAAGTLRSLETRANPYGAPEDRANWIEDLNVRVLQPGDSVDYLYWVGCVSAFDKRKQKIARALVSLMNHAGLNFGILGTVEGCTGDPARRLGEENLFQSLAKSNIATLQSIRFETLVANCPHCFNTIKNEYPEFGNLGDGRQPEILHHSVLLKRLLKDNRLNIEQGHEEYTFHDPCYLGRYNDEYEAPRETLKRASSLAILEPERSREKGLCCGAGGGHFWMDMKVGERVNSLRVDELAETGATKIATACPFCMQMMEDGVKLTNREETMEVRDIAEVLAERLKEE
jgi:Fe-S oxidoreductase/nitrate reductase gamma subunit